MVMPGYRRAYDCTASITWFAKLIPLERDTSMSLFVAMAIVTGALNRCWLA